MPIVRLNTTTNTNSLKTNVKQAHVRIESLGSALCGAHVRVIVCIENVTSCHLRNLQAADSSIS